MSPTLALQWAPAERTATGFAPIAGAALTHWIDRNTINTLRAAQAAQISRDAAQGFAASAGAAAAVAVLPSAVALDLRTDAPSFWLDPDMTGRAGNGWAANETALVVNGRKAIRVSNSLGNCAVKLPDSVAVGDSFTISGLIEAATLGGGTYIDLNVEYPAGTFTAITSVGAATPLPAFFSLTLTRQAGANTATFYVFAYNNAANSITLSLLGGYKGSSGAYRPALNGREVPLATHLGENAAAQDAARNPNVWADPYITGLTAAGWNAAVTVVTSAEGFLAYRVVGAVRSLNRPISDLGAPGDAVAAVARMRSFCNVGNSLSAYLRFNRVDGTTINTYSLSLSQTATTNRWLDASVLTTIPAGTATYDLVIDTSTDAANWIELALPSVHRGTLPFWRPVSAASTLYGGATAARPTGAKPGQPYFDTTLGQFVISDGAGAWTPYSPSSGSAAAVFDIYVDGTPGSNIASDLNDGAKDTPFATIGAAIAAVGSAANKKIGLKYGSIFHEGITSSASGLAIAAYGDATLAKPTSIGSTNATAFTSIGGGKYTVAAANEPGSLALVTGGVRKKLYLQPSGAAAVGEWIWASGTITFYPSADPTGSTLEIGGDFASGAGLTAFEMTGPSQTLTNLAARGFGNAGAAMENANPTCIGCDFSFNSQDGIDFGIGATGFLLRYGTFNDNGRGWGLGGGPGDGVSAHNNPGYGAASGIIEFNTFMRNTQTGVGNQDGCTITTRYNVMQDNHTNWNLYNTGATGITVSCHHNLLVHSAIRKGQFTGNGTAGIAVNIHNNTCWTNPTATGFCLAPVSFDGCNVDLANNILSGPADYGASGPAGSIHSRNNIYFGVGAISRSDSYAVTSTVNDLTSDPQLIGPTTGNFAIKSTSPAKASGVGLGYTLDYYQRPSPTTPDRGAVQRQ